jgi:hypothetical protein
MVFDTTYNNISIIFWQSLLLAEETAVTGTPTELPRVTDKTLSHNVVSSIHPAMDLIPFLMVLW